MFARNERRLKQPAIKRRFKVVGGCWLGGHVSHGVSRRTRTDRDPAAKAVRFASTKRCFGRAFLIGRATALRAGALSETVAIIQYACGTVVSARAARRTESIEVSSSA